MEGIVLIRLKHGLVVVEQGPPEETPLLLELVVLVETELHHLFLDYP